MGFKLVWREWIKHKVYPLLFSLCLVLSLSAYLTLDSLQSGVEDYIDSNQKEIVGGDVIVQSRTELPSEVKEIIAKQAAEDVVKDYQFNAIAYTEDASILSRIKAVTPAYPLYGELELRDAGTKPITWSSGSVLVEQQVLSTLNLSIGDEIQIGETVFNIADEIITEPDRPLTAFGFGARILMKASDLPSTGLVGQRSRVNYRVEIRAEELEKEALLQALQSVTEDTRIRVSSAEESNTSVSLLSNNFLIFLKLLVIAVIVLSGVGLMSIVKSFLAEQYKTVAIRRTLGERSSQIVASYRKLFLIMALVGVFIACCLSALIIYLGSDLFSAILPKQLLLNLSLWSVIKTTLIAVIMCWLMTGSSLQRLETIKPVAILNQHEVKAEKKKSHIIFTCLAVIGVLVLLRSELNSWWQSTQVMLAIGLVWIVLYVINRIILGFLRRHVPKQWLFRLSIQNIFRKGAQSSLFITVMAMTTMVLWIITLLDHSINDQLISSYPEDAPNMFLLDIQPDQQDQLNQMIPAPLVYYPVVRARVDSVNGVSAEILKDTLGRYDDVTRVFNLSYADEVLPTERLISSVQDKRLYSTALPADDEVVSLSVLKSIADYLQVGLGDRVVFNIQGINLEAEITSIRERLKRGPSPFFYFLFEPEVLSKAPQIRFATTRLNTEQRVRLQTEIAAAFPGITTLDGGSIAKQLKVFVDQLKQLVQIFTALSLLAGLLIFVASLISTSQDRYRESSYYRLMGMFKKDLYWLAIIEFLFLGLSALIIGTSLATLISWLLVTQWFSIAFIFPWQIFVNVSVVFCIFMFLVSLFYTKQVLSKKPLDYIRLEG